LLSSTETDTVITDLFTGRPARSIRNQFIEKYLQLGTKPLAYPLQALAADDIYSEARKQNLADYCPLLAGQGLRLLKRDQSASEIISEIVSMASTVVSSNLIKGIS
jgi:nitronate monooxygenase